MKNDSFHQTAGARREKGKTRFRSLSAAAVRIALLIGMVFVPSAAFAPQARIPAQEPAKHDLRPAPGVRAVSLSDYLPALAGTPGDTAVYVIEGAKPGGTAFVSGGTHANEIAGIMAAVLLVERAEIGQGRIIVVPHANNSAITYTDPAWPGGLDRFTVRTPSGERTFAIGTRLTRPEHQGEPDPAGEKAAWSESDRDNLARNLDRQFPGKSDGNLTQRIAWAVVEIIRKEGADLAFDLHEAPPGSRLAMMVVAHPKNSDLAAEAVLTLESQGLAMKLEESSADFRGLSHREWGDATGARSFLFETPNPAALREKPGHPVDDPEWPLARRVGIHLETLGAVIAAYNGVVPSERRIGLSGLPDTNALMTSGLGAFLR